MKIENEQGVIVEFARQAENAGFKIVSIRTEYPDAIIEKNGIEYRTEFEFMAGSFKDHGHDIRECDLIICWEQGFFECPLPIIELSKPGWKNTLIAKIPQSEKDTYYWKEYALSLERQIRELKKSKPIQNGKRPIVIIGDDINTDSMSKPERQSLVERLWTSGVNDKEYLSELVNVSIWTIERDIKDLNLMEI